MAGEKIFEAALNHWNDNHQFESVDTLIVAGISAGAIGVINHLELLQKFSRDVNATNLRLIVDSSDVGSQQPDLYQDDERERKEQEANFAEIVDFEKHPLCNSTYSQEFTTTELWNIPCCASVHCMLENDPMLSNWTQTDDPDGSERMLMLDSVYDPLGIMLGTRKMDSEHPNLLDFDAYTSGIFEAAGSRGQQILQSSTRLGNRVLWAVSNVVVHTYLLPAIEINQLSCNDHDPTDDFYVVCKDNSYGKTIRFA